MSESPERRSSLYRFIPPARHLTLEDPDTCPFAEGTGQYGETIEYFNNLDYPVYIGDRNGLKMELQPRCSPQAEKKLYIVRRIRYDVNKTIPHLPDASITDANARFVKAWHSDKVKRIDPPPTNGHNPFKVMTLIFTYAVEDVELKSLSSVYLHTIDSAVSIHPTWEWTNPYSPEGMFARGLQDGAYGKLTSKNAFSYNIEIVAPSEEAMGPKFVNIGNVIYRIPIIPQQMRAPGVYITYNNQLREDGTSGPIKQEVFDLSELKKGVYDNKEKSLLPLKFYNNADDALYYGDTEREFNRQRQFELRDKEHEIAQLKLQVEKLKQEQAERDAKLKILQAERDEVKSQQDHYRNMRKADRQETLEYLKWVPAILGTALTIFNLIKK